jgi:hypothetical protein
VNVGDAVGSSKQVEQQKLSEFHRAYVELVSWSAPKYRYTSEYVLANESDSVKEHVVPPVVAVNEMDDVVIVMVMSYVPYVEQEVEVAVV